MKRLLFVTLLLFVSFLTTGCTGDAGLKNEVKELKKEISDLKKVVETLSKRPSETRQPGKPKKAKTRIDSDPFMGKTDAPLVVVEFSDYECPFCGRFFRETLPKIKNGYINTGKVKYVYKDFPLDFHKKAPKAAEAAHCAGEKGKFWEMHDLIFKNQQQMDIPGLISRAEKLGLNVDEFKKCVDDGRYAEGIMKDIEAGQKIGLRGTPSFVIGKLNKDGEVEGVFIEGAAPFPGFKKVIDALLDTK